MKIITPMILLALSLNAFSAEKKRSCMENLTKDYSQAVVHYSIGELEMDVAEKINRTEAKAAINVVLAKSNCRLVQFERANCRTISRGDADSKVCYASNKYGYFIVTRDYHDRFHVLFNNWD